jgi:hypothetical protein
MSNDFDDSNDAAPVYPAPGSEIPGQPSYVVGNCGHRVAGSEWRAGYRVCERCPSEAAMAEQLLTADEMSEAIRDTDSAHYLTEAECRDALTFLSGWTAEGFTKAIAFISRQRGWRAARDRDAAQSEECTR